MFKYLPLLLLLTGCSAINAYRMGKYDNVEHDKINYIRTLAETSADNCDTPEYIKGVSSVILVKSIEYKNFSATLPNNEEAGKLGGLLVELTTGFKKSYDSGSPSKVVCELKLKNIEDSAKRIQTVIARKPR